VLLSGGLTGVLEQITGNGFNTPVSQEGIMLKTFVFKRGEELLQNISVEGLAEVVANKESILWVDLDLPTPEEVKQVLVKAFAFHPLAIEDCQTPAERPKVESYGEYLFLVLPAEGLRLVEGDPDVTEICCFLGDNYLVTYHRRSLSCFDTISKRCEANPKRTLGRGPAFVMHGIIDALVDGYFPHIKKVDDELDALEAAIFEKPAENVLNDLLDFRERVQTLRRVLSPQRDILTHLCRASYPQISSDVQVYLRDVVDHLLRLVDNIDNFRYTLSGFMEIYLSLTSNRMNQVMKTLTVIATIMMPLSVLTGIYGMNFKFMPEKDWPLGYAFFWLLALGISGSMLYYFRRKKWF